MPAAVEQPAPNAETAWRAVVGCDRRYDGVFVYAVYSTGVFCRPSCPSRTPKRENVAFFGTPETARRAGFRACRRCRPGDEAGTPAEQAVNAARDHIAANLDRNVTLDELAELTDRSPAHLQRTFKRLIGLSPREYQRSLRLSAFRRVSRAAPTALDAGTHAGFGSSRALYDAAPSGLGMTPGAYRRGGDGVTITFGIDVVDLGQVLVATTDRGVCAILLGEDGDQLHAELAGEFPRAAIIRDDDTLAPLMKTVQAAIDGDVSLPDLDAGGTEFQRVVWAALQRIPRGERWTYAQLAAAIGRPDATRAVAGACARNRIAVLIPCHRVIRSDGGSGGYRWGVRRKQTLLDRESIDEGSSEKP